jgi:hypothetical protein
LVFEYKKFQAPKTKYQKNPNDPNSKSQMPSIFVPNSIISDSACFLNDGVKLSWFGSLDIEIYLKFGAWDLGFYYPIKHSAQLS